MFNCRVQPFEYSRGEMKLNVSQTFRRRMNIVHEITWWLWCWWSMAFCLCWIIEPVSGIKGREVAESGPSITSAAHHRFQGLSYPEESEMGVFFALAIPLDDPVSTKAISVAFFFEANYQLTEEKIEDDNNEDSSREERSINPKRRVIDRRTIYAMLESRFESLGFPGRICLLRCICETSRHPINRHNGLLGDLLRILFAPSSSRDEGLSVEYAHAENPGNDDCGTIYALCPFDIYDYITTRY